MTLPLVGSMTAEKCVISLVVGYAAVHWIISGGVAATSGFSEVFALSLPSEADVEPAGGSAIRLLEERVRRKGS